MIRNWKLTLALATFAATFAFIVTTAPRTQAEPPVEGDGVAASQLRRVVDPSERSATGDISFFIKGNKQYCRVNVTGLAETDFGVYLSGFPKPVDITETSVGPLDRLNSKKGTWTRAFTGTNGAPLEFPTPSLHDFEGGIILVGTLTEDDELQNITNIVNGVTNVVIELPFPVVDSGTNIVGVVGNVLWAPINTIAPVNRKDSFSGHIKLNLPDVPPDPHAKGTISARFDSTHGRSLLSVRATGLERGQHYHIFVSDTPTNTPPLNLIDSGTMTSSKSGSSQVYIRDTQFGDPLPLQSRNVGDLSGHLLVIRDALQNIVLQIVLP